MTGIFTLGALGLSLSVDAFAAAMGKGTDGQSRRLSHALRIGALFGLTEAISPAIGWLIGRALSGWIMAVGDWVAFALLAAVGGHMLWMAWRGGEAGPEGDDDEAPRAGFGRVRLVLTAMATSIDALAVGVSLAVLDIGILPACLVIGMVTTLVATCGVLIGHRAGRSWGAKAEAVGGLVLIGIGAMIPLPHLLAG